MAVAALATAAQDFKTTDLSESVKFSRAAEKGWDNLKTSKQQPDADALLLAAVAMQKISDDADIQKTLDSARADIKSISPEMAIIAGETAKNIPVNTEITTDTAQIPKTAVILPALAMAGQHSKTSIEDVQEFLTDAFGYVEIPLNVDPHLKMSAGWSDPLQWLATKTGDIAIQTSQTLSREGITPHDPKTGSKELKNYEDKNKLAQARFKEGYDKLTFTTLDRAYLAYALALLNQNIGPSRTSGAKHKNPTNRYNEPVNPIKGYYPKAI